MTYCAQRAMRQAEEYKPRNLNLGVYAKHNVCWGCRLKFPKIVDYCSVCHNRLRTHSPYYKRKE